MRIAAAVVGLLAVMGAGLAGGGVEYKPEIIYVGVSGGGYTDVRWRTYGGSLDSCRYRGD